MENQDADAKKETKSANSSAPVGVVTATTTGVEGINGPFPAELNRWNWGAFFLTWIWGLANNVYIALVVLVLGFIPFIGLGMSIYLGIKGNELAWKNRKFANIEEFNAVQIAWTKWGVVLFIASFLFGILMVMLGAAVGWHSANHAASVGTSQSPSIEQTTSTSIPTSNFPY